MKRNHLLIALTAAMLPMGFAACSSDDDNDDTAPATYATPAHQADAASFTVSGNTTRSVVFGEGGSVVIGRVADTAAVKATRAAGTEAIKYLVGTYTKSNATYIIYVNSILWGTIKVEQTAADAYALTITTTDATGSEQVEQAEATKEDNVGSSSVLNDLCRTWQPKHTRVYLQKQPYGTMLTSPAFNGCSFEEVKQWAEDESDCRINDEFGNDYIVKDVFLTRTGTFCIDFQNGKNYVGQYTWDEVSTKEGRLTYEWADGETMGCSYENGTASIEFKGGAYSGECWLTLEADIKSGSDTYHVQLVIRLKEAA